jgi:biopolymer transport protein ExbD
MQAGMKKSKHQEVEVQITPMLDMAFQLLTFFILTYHPSPIEGQFAMNLLPAAPVVDMNAPPTETNQAQPNDSIPAALRTMTTSLHAGPRGELGRVTIGDNEVQGMPALEEKLTAILNDKNLPFDQALIQADPNLRYEELIKVINIYSKLKITKISFAELTDTGGGGGPAL